MCSQGKYVQLTNRALSLDLEENVSLAMLHLQCIRRSSYAEGFALHSTMQHEKYFGKEEATVYTVCIFVQWCLHHLIGSVTNQRLRNPSQSCSVGVILFAPSPPQSTVIFFISSVSSYNDHMYESLYNVL